MYYENENDKCVSRARQASGLSGQAAISGDDARNARNRASTQGY